MKISSILIPLVFLVSCVAPVEEDIVVYDKDISKSMIDSASLADRVADAGERLLQTSAGKLVWRPIDAHGGLENWYKNGPLKFRFDYEPEPGQTGIDRKTISINDYWASRAVHTIQNQDSLQFGFDGRRAWSTSGEKVGGINPRFWSLTPYYFVGLPFVLADEGVVLDSMPDAVLNDISYNMVKVSYEEGTGDAPDDYYVLYLNAATGQLDGLRYVVSYPGFFEQGQHSPEKLMQITGKTTVSGIVLPTGYETRMWQGGDPSSVVTKIGVSEYSFLPEAGDEVFAMPKGAKEFAGL